jgi:hypothetical protein
MLMTSALKYVFKSHNDVTMVSSSLLMQGYVQEFEYHRLARVELKTMARKGMN